MNIKITRWHLIGFCFVAAGFGMATPGDWFTGLLVSIAGVLFFGVEEKSNK
jgi:hypothetical protein